MKIIRLFLYSLGLATLFVFFAQDQVLAACGWEYNSTAVNFAGLCNPIPPIGTCTCGTDSVTSQCDADPIVSPGEPEGWTVVASCVEREDNTPPGGSNPDPGIVSGPYLMVCPSSEDISVGETLQLEARYFHNVQETSIPSMNCQNTRSGITPYSTVSSSADWSSARESRVTVSDTGMVTGVDLGSSRITARYGGLSASSNISVVRPPLLLICPSSTTLAVGETQSLQARYWDSAPRSTTTCASGGYSNVTRSADWSSDNTGTATIGNDCNLICRLLRSGGNKGLLTGIASGSTQVKALYNGLTASADVTVPGIGGSISVDLTSQPTEVEEGGAIDLTWTTTGNPDSCIASDGWVGSKNVGGGTESVNVTFGEGLNKTFTLTCSKAGEPDASDSVTVSKIPEGGLKQLIIKEGSCSSGNSSQVTLSQGEFTTLSACDDTNGLVSADWETADSSCIALSGGFPSETMPIQAVGTPPCSTNITASATGYESDRIPAGIEDDDDDDDDDNPPQSAPWKEIAP